VASLLTDRDPQWAVPGGQLLVEAEDLPLDRSGPPEVRVGGERAHVLAASRTQVRILVPPVPEGPAGVHIGANGPEIARVQVARRLATGLHQVDSPAFDGLGRLFATHSGSRGEQVQVPIFRIGRDGTSEAVPVEIPNPTGFALGPDGAMYVSSRFEGQVLRLSADDQVELYASDLGVPTGLAFAPDGSLFVGDRSGSVLRIDADRQVSVFASLPPSVAAFHLAFGPDERLYVTAPTLASHDPVYRITPDRLVETFVDGFGRPQGLAFDSHGDLYVVDALAGASALYRIAGARADVLPERLLSAPQLIGLAFDPAGGLVFASNDTVWRLDVPLRPLPLIFANR
jgi:DNA-binding beta-propeller fold protein YncE